MKKNHPLIWGLLGLLLLGCSRNVPVIKTTYWQMNWHKNLENNRIESRLSFFAGVNDDDGFDDIEKMYLFHDEKQLYWELTPDNWETSQVQNETWIGSNSIRSNTSVELPSGEYRVVLQDFSGETDEKYFTLPAGKKATRFPVVTLEGRKVSVTGHLPSYVIWLYDGANRFIRQILIRKEMEMDLGGQIPGGDSSFYFDVYYFDQNLETGVSIGPYYPGKEE